MSVLGDLIDATSGLLLHWPMDDTSGTTAVDTSGAGLNGTYHGSPTLGEEGPGFCNDPASRSIYLPGDGTTDGTADYAHRATSPLSGNVAHTHEVWFRPDTDSFTRPGRRYANLIQQRAIPPVATSLFRVVADAEAAGGAAWGIYYGANGFLNGAGGPLSGLRTECWHHIAVTRDAADGTIRVYLDGALHTTPGASSVSLTAEHLSFGGDHPDIVNPLETIEEMELFKGRMAHGAVYNRALTDGEIAERWALTCGCDEGGWGVGQVRIA